MIITLKYKCGCEWDFPMYPPILNTGAPVENGETDCPFCRGVVDTEWMEQDIRGNFIRLSEVAKERIEFFKGDPEIRRIIGE